MMIPEKEKLLDMYKMMLRMRKFEERAAKEFAAGKIPGIIHPYVGQEAVATGVCAALRPDDYITSTYRGHGHLIGRGGRTDLMMAELYGKKTGYNKGKGGSMHVADFGLGIVTANGIVGAGITIAGGAALSAQLRGTDQVTACFFGDGATNTTRFHEGINLAACWDLPVVYIIENNLYGESTCILNTCKLTNLSDRAVSYGIPGKTADGNNVLEVYEEAIKAVDRARKGQGPTLIEFKTYRQRGHFEGDKQTYKSREEIDEWLKKDPISKFKKYLFETNSLAEEEDKKIDKETSLEIERAIKFAEESPFPEAEEALEDVYA